MADAPDSKSGDGNIVRVQVPPPAPYEKALIESIEIDYQRFLILHFSVKFPFVKYYHYTTTEHFIQIFIYHSLIVYMTVAPLNPSLLKCARPSQRPA
jgi:hypothetical protein